MRLATLLSILLIGCATTRPAAAPGGPVRWGIVIHGGAGNIDPAKLPPEA